MTVITISREAASGGDRLAAEVAKELGYRLVDKDFVGRVLDQYGLIEFHREYNSYLSFWDKLDAERTAQRKLLMGLLTETIVAVAQTGNVVIVGRSGFAALGGYGDVLNVRIQAPLDVRVKRLAAERGVPESGVREELETVAKMRADFVDRFYDKSWFDARGFDLVFDTSKIPEELAIRYVVDAARALDASGVENPVASAEADPVVVSAVAQEISLMEAGIH